MKGLNKYTKISSAVDSSVIFDFVHKENEKKEYKEFTQFKKKKKGKTNMIEIKMKIVTHRGLKTLIREYFSDADTIWSYPENERDYLKTEGKEVILIEDGDGLRRYWELSIKDMKRLEQYGVSYTILKQKEV